VVRRTRMSSAPVAHVDRAVFSGDVDAFRNEVHGPTSSQDLSQRVFRDWFTVLFGLWVAVAGCADPVASARDAAVKDSAAVDRVAVEATVDDVQLDAGSAPDAGSPTMDLGRDAPGDRLDAPLPLADSPLVDAPLVDAPVVDVPVVDVRLLDVAVRRCVRTSDCADGDPCTLGEVCASGFCVSSIRDDDGDGVAPVACGGLDCDDDNAAWYPGALERCNGVDDDCDGAVDEAGVDPLCRDGACVRGRCDCGSARIFCDNHCVDPATDELHCGACDVRCVALSSCQSGRCFCSLNRTLCPLRCIEPFSDSNYCGGCDRICRNAQPCTDGVCTCSGGDTRCNGLCVDLRSTDAHCGACGAACDAAHGCSGGLCRCWFTATACGERCVDTERDPVDCGRCGRVCPAAPNATAGCDRGVCTVVCNPGLADCDGDPANGCEADVRGGRAHCGGCGRSCTGACVLGVCEEAEWLRGLGGTGDDEGQFVAANPRGDVFLAGHFEDALRVGDVSLARLSNGAGFLAAMEPGGGVRWLRRIGSSQGTTIYGVAVDAAGNAFVTGFTSGRFDLGGGSVIEAGPFANFLVCFTRDGAIRWSRLYPGNASPFATTNNVAVDASGNVFLVAQFGYPEGFGYVPPREYEGVMLLSLRGDGVQRWAATFDRLMEPAGLAVDAGGNVVMTGAFRETLSMGGSLVRLRSAGSGDAFALGITNGGQLRWARRWGGEGDEKVAGVAVDAAGNAYVAGLSRSPTVVVGAETIVNGSVEGEVYLVALDPRGVPRWARGFTASGVSAVTLDGAGGVHLGGEFLREFMAGTDRLQPMGFSDAYIVSLGTDGTVRRGRRLGGSGQDAIRGLGTVGGSLLATGRFVGALPFAGGGAVSGGRSDAWVARLNP